MYFFDFRFQDSVPVNNIITIIINSSWVHRNLSYQFNTFNISINILKNVESMNAIIIILKRMSHILIQKGYFFVVFSYHDSDFRNHIIRDSIWTAIGCLNFFGLSKLATNWLFCFVKNRSMPKKVIIYSDSGFIRYLQTIDTCSQYNSISMKSSFNSRFSSYLNLILLNILKFNLYGSTMTIKLW